MWVLGIESKQGISVTYQLKHSFSPKSENVVDQYINIDIAKEFCDQWVSMYPLKAMCWT
jgi:hypothetical protein